MANLTPNQIRLIRCSSHNPRTGHGFGVELRGAGEWRTARSLERLKLGDIQYGMPNGSNLPGLFFANADAVQLLVDLCEEQW